MARTKQSDKYVIRGKGEAVFELDDLTPQIARQVERGEVTLLTAPPAEPAKDAADAPSEV